MEKLNNVEAYQVVNNMLSRNDMQIDESIKNRIVDIYSSLMNNETNKYKSLEIQKSMIEDIVYSKIKNEDERFIFQRYSDVKHLEYLDTFANRGETQLLLDSLREKGISVDVLKGIKYALNMNNEKSPIDKNVEISQSFSQNSPPELESFEVKYNGETIYKFEGEKDILSDFTYSSSDPSSIKEKLDIGIMKEKNYKLFKEIVERTKTMKRKSKSEGLFYSINEKDIKNISNITPDIVEAIEFRIKQKVRKAYRDARTGRFVSVKNNKLF